jgi:hypothetical protein
VFLCGPAARDNAVALACSLKKDRNRVEVWMHRPGLSHQKV